MEIIKKHSLGVAKKYVYIIAFVISIIVLFQVSNAREGILQIYLGDIVYYLSNYFVWAFLIEYINGAIQSINFKNKFKGITNFIISILIIAFIHLVITNILYYTHVIITAQMSITGAFNDFKPIIIASLLSRFLDISIIIVLLRILDTYQKLQAKKLQIVSLEKDLHQSQLLALQSQLNPHFLFNSLHTLNTLIGYDDDKARSMVIKITHLLRKILNHKETPYITFKEELEYFKNYLEIEQERFNDRLQVTINVDEATNDIEVPTLFLQPLIENAFKHGVSQVDGIAKIELTADIIEKDLSIYLKNTIPKQKKATIENSTHIGLKNLKQRLEAMFIDGFDFFADKVNNTFVVKLRIKNIK